MLFNFLILNVSFNFSIQINFWINNIQIVIEKQRNNNFDLSIVYFKNNYLFFSKDKFFFSISINNLNIKYLLFK